MLRSSSGYATGYIIMFVIVIIFAVMLSGGSRSLLTGNHASPDYSDDVSPTPTASPSATWSINFKPTNCIKDTIPQLEGEVYATGPSNGYITFEVQDSSDYKVITTSAFNKPETTFNVILSSKDGFNNMRWKLNIFSGGSLSGGKWAGGEKQGNGYSGEPTGC